MLGVIDANLSLARWMRRWREHQAHLVVVPLAAAIVLAVSLLAVAFIWLVVYRR